MSGAFLCMGVFVGLFPFQHFWFISNETVSLYWGAGVKIQDEDQLAPDHFFAGRLRKVLDKHIVYILIYCIFYSIVYIAIYTLLAVLSLLRFSVLFVLLSSKVKFNENGLQFWFLLCVYRREF